MIFMYDDYIWLLYMIVIYDGYDGYDDSYNG